MALGEVALVPGHVRKTRLVLTNEIATELFNLSAQPQLCELEPLCCPHLVEQWRFDQTNTWRTQVEGIANLQWAASDLSNPQSLTHAAVTCGPIWLCVFHPAVLHGSTPLSCGIATHYPGYFHGCWFDQALSCCVRRYCSCIFPSNNKSTHCFIMGVGFYSWSRWTINMTSRYPVFFLFEKLKAFANILYSMVKLLWEIRAQGLLSITRTVAGFHRLPRLN